MPKYLFKIIEIKALCIIVSRMSYWWTFGILNFKLICLYNLKIVTCFKYGKNSSETNSCFSVVILSAVFSFHKVTFIACNNRGSWGTFKNK